LRTGTFFIAALYVVLSISLGLLGVWFGVMIARVIS
jgi:fluoride ion exporter CrcB/FEX